MKKYIDFIAVFLLLILVFIGCVGCADDRIANGAETTSETNNFIYSDVEAEESNMEISEYVSDDGVNNLIYASNDGYFLGKYNSIEEVKSVEEEKSILKEKEEFLQFFENFSGFSLPDYFIFPKVTRETDWNNIYIR